MQFEKPRAVVLETGEALVTGMGMNFYSYKGLDHALRRWYKAALLRVLKLA
jgi:hypothetical protein